MAKIDITRKPNETEFDYHKRIIFGKLVDKTLTDIDYTELAELAYGQSFSSDVARRMFYGSKRTIDKITKEMMGQMSQSENSDSILTELDEKMIELRKERQKFFDQRREYNKLLSEDARKENLCETLVRSAKKLGETIGALYNNQIHSVDVTSDNEAVLVFSDWHLGLKTENVFNKYDFQICKDRVKEVVTKASERIKLHQCRKLHIVVLGDLYHGAIHNSARVASEEYVCDQLMQAAEILAQSVEYLSQYVEDTIVYMTYGNHARTVQNKNDSIHRDNMERIMPWWLEQRFANHSSIIIAPDEGHEFVFINSCGHEICATHGDNDSVKTAPRLLATLFQKKYGKDVEYILLGDKHHRESFDELGITAFLCGSLCGTDDYANNKRLYSEPTQILLITNPDCGVDAEYRIKCC